MRIGTTNNSLKDAALFVLFGTSYTPLFLLIAFRQIVANSEYLHFHSLSSASIQCFLTKFCVPVFLIVISIWFLWKLKILLAHIDKRADNNSDPAVIIKINNRNNEALGYIATYIVPFISYDNSNWIDVCCFIVIMAIIYGIYTKSNMILINPVLNLRYSIYEIEYTVRKDKIRDGLLLVKGHELEEDEIIKIYPIGFKLFYGKFER